MSYRHSMAGVLCVAMLAVELAYGVDPPATDEGLFRRDNLIAWCIVPFDSKKRSPEQRAAMLQKLGFKHFAYDYRVEHKPTFDAEIAACKQHGISFDAWWFPKTLNNDARLILETCRRNNIHPQLWVSGGGEPTKSPEEQLQRVETETARIRPIAEAAAAQGMKVGLYNHGGWFGEPDNQLAIIEKLKLPNVGIVYNLHHGHDQASHLAELLKKMMPHLLAVNLNGMVPEGDKRGQKILQLGQGTLDLELLRTIRDSGYRGPIGILGHTMEDAEARLQDNLDGLDWLLPQLDGQPAGPKPKPRTPVPTSQPPKSTTSAAPSELPKGRAPLPPPGPHLKGVDPQLRTVLIDRSSDDVYMGVKVDREGHVFVGGREAVFVFAPDGRGGFEPRQELLRFPPDSIIMGLEYRDNDLYVLTSNALYRIPEGRVRRTELKPQRLLWGLPLDLHVSFHCLAWGPDGDLYVTHGDPLLQYGYWERPDHWGHWTLYCGPDNHPLPYTGQGAVLRMKPDGTNVRVVAGGLRGPVGLAFDRAGNLFTNDNDHESKADRYAPSRLLHVVDGIDFGWPRGWMASKSPDRFDLIEPMCDLGRGAPCDLLYYDRPMFTDLFGDQLLMCRWDSYSVTSYRLKQHGATFEATEATVAVGQENCRPVGIATDQAGRLFVTALYMTGNMAAPDCASDLLMIARTTEPPLAVKSAQAVEPKPITTGDPLADARGNDLYLRQLGVAKLSQNSVADLQRLAASTDDPTRLAAILAMGRKLTVPAADFVPPANLKLFYPKGGAFFHREQSFFGESKPIDLIDFNRVGSFTIAQWWDVAAKTHDQEELFASLIVALDDSSDRVRLQAAHFLSLLNDKRSQALVERTQRDVLLGQLQSAPKYPIEKAWTVGPFDDEGTLTPPHGLEVGSIDLTASYDGRNWQERVLVEAHEQPAPPSEKQSTYFYFRVHSGVRQTALLTLTGDAGQLWQNETWVREIPGDAKQQCWIVDLQPGSNDLLLRTADVSRHNLVLQATSKLEITLPEKVDSAQLAERLRAAAASGTTQQAVPEEFAAVDWSQAATQGNVAEGRRLFGVLGCAKCHAIVPDQKTAGAPSLFEAKRRFTIPHIVESVLLPSRQVAEPFRSQVFVTDNGVTYAGLVTSENADTVELLLPDATRQKLAKSEIEERHVTQLSPMPQMLVKTPGELRDLLAYLLSDRPTPP